MSGIDRFALPPDLVADWGFGPLRDVALLESALSAPLQEWGNVRFYPTVVEQAAVLLERLVRNHAFVDGNKRTAWRACRVFLAARGITVDAEVADVVLFVEAVAHRRADHAAIVRWLNARSGEL